MRKNKILYLGLRIDQFKKNGKIFHHPIIKIHPRIAPSFKPSHTHILMTSRTTVDLAPSSWFENKVIISIGKKTTLEIEKKGFKVDFEAQEETQEGIIEELKKIAWSEKHLFFPHGSLSRPCISNYLNNNNISFSEAILYDTLFQPLPINPLDFDEIVFTSSSTVDAFFFFFGKFPKNVSLNCLGPITKKTLEKYLSKSYS